MKLSGCQTGADELAAAALSMAHSRASPPMVSGTPPSRRPMPEVAMAPTKDDGSSSSTRGSAGSAARAAATAADTPAGVAQKTATSADSCTRAAEHSAAQAKMELTRNIQAN